MLVKANLFNEFFREQCRPITNDSSLFNNQVFETVTRLSNFTIDTDTIIKLIRSLDPNKAHICDGISIYMLKLCETSILKPLHILFNYSVMNEYFSIFFLCHSCLFAAKVLKKLPLILYLNDYRILNSLLEISQASSQVIQVCISCSQ